MSDIISEIINLTLANAEIFPTGEIIYPDENKKKASKVAAFEALENTKNENLTNKL